MPTALPLASIGKPVFSSSDSAPIYGGSPSNGVYADQIWINAEPVWKIEVTITNLVLGSNSAFWIGENFGMGNTMTNDSYRFHPIQNSTVFLGFTIEPRWYRFFRTRRQHNISGTYNLFRWDSTLIYPAYVYKVPVGATTINGITALFLNFAKTSKMTFFASCIIYLADTLADAENIIADPAYSSTEIPLSDETEVDLENKFVVIIPKAFSSPLGESYYTKTTANDDLGNLADVSWALTELGGIYANQILFRVKQ